MRNMKGVHRWKLARGLRDEGHPAAHLPWLGPGGAHRRVTVGALDRQLPGGRPEPWFRCSRRPHRYLVDMVSDRQQANNQRCRKGAGRALWCCAWLRRGTGSTWESRRSDADSPPKCPDVRSFPQAGRAAVLLTMGHFLLRLLSYSLAHQGSA